MYLIAGLGNPGLKYADTRHNIGYRIIDQIARNCGIEMDLKRFNSIAAHGRLYGKEALLIKPQTFMNLSGEAITGWENLHDIEPEKILVVHDDLDLPLGKIKAVRGGGAGGHRGVRSIIENISTNEFPRIKIGIGRPLHGEQIEDYVLEPFYEEDRETLESVILAGAKACQSFISKGIEFVMNNVNRKKFENKEEIS